MARKKAKNKLPSGSYRIQVFDYKDVDGKKHYKSFTAATKAEAQFLAAQWKTNRTEPEKPNLTLYEAVTRYIDIKRNVLSPGTIRGYEGIQKSHMKEIGRTSIYDLSSTTVQIWISNMAATLSPKSVKNAYGLLSATLDMFAPNLRLNVTLPARKKPDLYCPSDDDIKQLLATIKGTELEIAVLLAAFGPLRRGEICALTSDDIKGNTISVSKSVVRGPDGEWYTKQPKTYGSYRNVEFPPFVIQRMKGIKGQIIKCNPDRISGRFQKALKKAGLQHFRFHDLRHYAASIMHVIGVPDQYILQRGGWSSDNVMKTVYRNTIDLETARQNKKINQHFEKLSV